MKSARRFPLEDILTVTTDCLLSPRGPEAVYRLLGFMTGDRLTTAALPRALVACALELLAQHPQLADAAPPHDPGTPGLLPAWLKGMTQRHGPTLPVRPLPPGSWSRSDPLTEYASARRNAQPWRRK